MNKKTVLNVILVVSVLAVWGHSAMPALTSSQESSWVMELVRPLLELFVGKGNVTEHLVRKLAHFAEYSVLGAELFLWTRFNLTDRSAVRRFGIILLAGLVVAFVDEGIQLFAPGRSAQLSDVALDSIGVAAAGFVCLMVEKAFARKGEI